LPSLLLFLFSYILLPIISSLSFFIAFPYKYKLGEEGEVIEREKGGRVSE
jgi:hypothetical protein